MRLGTLLLPGRLLGGTNLLRGLRRGLRIGSGALDGVSWIGGKLRGTSLLRRLLLGASLLRSALRRVSLFRGKLRSPRLLRGLQHGASLLHRALRGLGLFRGTLRGPGQLRGLPGGLRLSCRKLCGASLFRGASVLNVALGSLLGGHLRSLLSHQLRGLTCGFLAYGLLSGSLLTPGLFLGLGRFGGQAKLRGVLGLNLRLGALLYVFRGLQYTQASLLAGLRPGGREVSVLGAMEIGPGVECRHVLWSVVLFR
jgi:hypothetical protein